MTRSIVRVGALGALLIAGAGCASNPLVGRWTSMDNAGGVSITTTINLAGNGTADISVAGGMSCTGSQTVTGATWSSDSASITFGGTPACTGEVVCMVSGVSVTINCGMTGTSAVSGSTAYTLSNNNMTLTLGSRAYTRTN